MKHLIARTLIFLISLSLTAPVFAQQGSGRGALYVMTNAALSNEVVIYNRAGDGGLTFVGSIATGGLGPTDRGDAFNPLNALGSQGSLILSQNNRWLFAVNAGSNEISVFRVLKRGLSLVNKVDSGGEFPVSLTQFGNQLYVLNAGGDANITGFAFGNTGQLRPIAGSTRSLEVVGDNPPLTDVSPAQISFDPFGEKLIVTIKGSDEVRVFLIGGDKLPSDNPVMNSSAGTTPFGFVFDQNGHLFMAEVSELNEVGIPNSGAVSSYNVTDDGTLEVISTAMENFQLGTCWLAIYQRGNRRFIYTSNTGSDTISGYRVDNNGNLNLLVANGVSASTNSGPVDMSTLNYDDGFVAYLVSAGSGTVGIFRINERNGSLEFFDEVGGLPVNDGAMGLAAF